LIQDIVWDFRGNNYGTTSRDRKVRIVDGRSAEVVQEIVDAHEGSKAMKMTFLGETGLLVTVGCTKQAQRQFKVWDQRNLSRELKKVDVDQGAGTMMPFYDNDTGVLYLAGKGDGNVRYYELTHEAPHCYGLADFKSSVSAKGMAWMPKRGLNILGCETARLLKLTNANSVEPLSFIVPRKAESFQADIYYDTAGSTAAHSIEQWLGGSDLPPVSVSLDPSGKANPRPSEAPTSPGGGASRPVSKALKTSAQLQLELDTALARITELEAKLQANGISP
jgi:coronin-1B/1C/6